jgi:hypothetical protein
MDSQKAAPPPEFLVGLDLGKSSDYTALAVVDRHVRPDPDDPAGRRRLAHYAVRHLVRFPLKTPYVRIVADVAELLRRPPLGPPPAPQPRLAADQTGVGVAVVEMLRAAQLHARLDPILITGGHEILWDDNGLAWHVPKKELVSTLQVIMQSARLKISEMPERKVIIHELQTFTAKINVATGHETFEAWRERDHDDMVLAVAMACWLGERPALPWECPAFLPSAPDGGLSSWEKLYGRHDGRHRGGRGNPYGRR